VQRGRADERCGATLSDSYNVHGHPGRRCVGSMSFQLCLRLGFYPNHSLLSRLRGRPGGGSKPRRPNGFWQYPKLPVPANIGDFSSAARVGRIFLISSPSFGAREKPALGSKDSVSLWIISHPQMWEKVGKIRLQPRSSLM
jgi:hypothetical protein